MKEFFTYEQQIEKLKAEGLQISDDEYVKECLKLEGYYNIINGYSCIFKINKRFINGTTFEDVELLYQFDKIFRSIVYKYIITIECHIKALIAYDFSKHYGINHEEYLKPYNFNFSETNNEKINKLIYKCNDAIQNGINHDSDKYRRYIANSFSKHKVVPLWILIIALTFGVVSKFYALMKSEEKTELAKHYGLNGIQLTNMLKILVSYRNIVAHGERLFCAKLPKLRLTELPIIKKLSLPKNNKYASCDCAALFIILKYLLPNNEFENFFKELITAYEIINQKLNKETMNKINKEMGLAGAWRKLSILKKFN